MKLQKKTLRVLADVICGNDRTRFLYRTGSMLTQFFEDCELPFVHDGHSTRTDWVLTVLEELNRGRSTNPHLPADSLIRVVQELLDPMHFRIFERDVTLQEVNDAFSRYGLQVYFDSANVAHIHRVGGGADSSSIRPAGRLRTPEETHRRELLGDYLNAATEDQFTEQILAPLLSRLGFRRLTVAGHEDKALEYGNDLWMKFQLPTSHSIYFGAQIKKGKIDASARPRSSRANVTELLNQVRMMVDYPLFDPEINRKVLVDHVFIIATGEITKQARNWLAGHLDDSKRRQLIFMDREEILALAVDNAIPLPTTLPDFPDQDDDFQF